MKNKHIYLIDTIFLLLYTIILFVATYLMRLDQIFFISGTARLMCIAYGILLANVIIIKCIVRDNYTTAIISTIVTFIITIISYYKNKVLTLPFLPGDALLIKNTKQISSFGLTFPKSHIFILTIILILILFLYYTIRKMKYEKKEICFKNDWYRIPLFIVGAILLYCVCIAPNRFQNLSITSDLGDSYTYMGGNAVFFLHIGDLVNIPPKGYSKENIEKMKNESITENKETISVQQPNVIYIMNESFSNPNKIKNVSYSVNPIQGIENLEKTDANCKIGNTVSPVLGGGTSLPEFEALTGLSSYFLEKQIMPYTAHIRSDMNSIVRLYRQNGYTTVGIHPNTQTFYNRKDVYNFLGFQETVFEENIENPEKKGGSISDNEFANQIIRQFEKNNGKKFIFGVTMQNHMPYTNKTYEQYDIDVISSMLDEKRKKELRNYVQGVYDGDKMYMKLVEYLKRTKEPTILIMFGDHLPFLDKYSLYKESNFTSLEYYETPYIIWSNYNSDYSEISNYISPSYLSMNILGKCEIDLPWYLKSFRRLYENYPVFNNQNVVTAEGKILEKDDVEYRDIVNDCRILQYDLLIKKKHIKVE